MQSPLIVSIGNREAEWRQVSMRMLKVKEGGGEHCEKRALSEKCEKNFKGEYSKLLNLFPLPLSLSFAHSISILISISRSISLIHTLTFTLSCNYLSNFVIDNHRGDI